MTLPDDEEILRRLNHGEPSTLLANVASLVGLGWEPARDLQLQVQAILESARVAFDFAQHGWAPLGLAPVEAYQQTRRLPFPDDDELDLRIARIWDDSGLLPASLGRIGALGVGVDRDVHTAAIARLEHVQEAWDHHRNGRYRASVLILAAQVEGISYDVTGKPFFSAKPSKADVRDAVTLAGMECALGVAREWFSRSVTVTSTAGSGSRHGIMHGRELGYGTLVNSWKYFVLLLATWEWANHVLHERHLQRRQDAAVEWAGSEELNDRGQRMDRRGFLETRQQVMTVMFAQNGYRATHGRLGDLDALTRQVELMGERADGVTVVLASPTDWWAWARSESGWVFAVGDVDGGPHRYFDGPQPPDMGPSSSTWRDDRSGNWDSQVVPGGA